MTAGSTRGRDGGGGGAWERLHYDWSDTRRVVMTTTDSDACGGKSGHVYSFTPRPNGTSRVDVTVVGDGKSFKGAYFAVLFKLVGQKVLGGAFEKTVAAIEARTEKQSA
jgi:hypothetical protein